MSEPLNKDFLRAELLDLARNEREASDKAYAPMLVKTILYTLLGTLAGVVVLGVGNLVTQKFIQGLGGGTDAQEAAIIKAYD